MDDLKSIIGKVATGATLSRDEAASAFDSMMSGEATPSQMGGLLMALRVRGETVDEITGAARVMRGKAIAGARGNADARILTLCLEPELVSIAGVYRTSENPLPVEVRGLAAQVSLQTGPDGDKLRVMPLKA